MKRRLENTNPTETEKLLFRHCGLYLIESNKYLLRYAPVHIEDCHTYLPIIENIDDCYIEYDNAIVFDCMSETIRFGNKFLKTEQFYDIDIMVLLLQRMKELGFKQSL